MPEIFKPINIALYLLIINIIGFLSMAIDKRLAQKNKWRISEETLFIISALGGGIGSIIGMYVCHHKTKKTLFTIGMPVICICEYLLLLMLKFGK